MDRVKAALPAILWHLCASVAVAALAAALVFGVWYPEPYAALVGGADLFWMVVVVDVVCGPLLTAVLYTPRKPKRELMQDLGLVALIQLSALVYGLYVVAIARPVYLVYEVDRFRVVTVADIQPGALNPDLGGVHALPWTGPEVIGVREPINPDEKLRSLELSLQGIEPSVRPNWWQAYELSKQLVLERAKPLDVLRKKQPEAATVIDRAVAEIGRPEAELVWVPLTSFKTTNWVAVVDRRSADILAFAPVDGF